MSYNTIGFFIFLLIFLVIYFLMPNTKLRMGVILLGNIYFYQTAGWSKLVVIFGVSIIVYLTSRKLEKIYSGFEAEKENLTPKEQVSVLAGYKKKCKKWIWLSLVLIVGMLVFVKIGKILKWEEVSSFADLSAGKLLVPLGISYYTFSSVAYIMDIYWRKTKVEHNYFKLVTCMTYFPHIIQGPIGRYDKLMKQFSELPGYDNKRVCFGLQLLLWGTFKKMVIADRLVLYTQTVFDKPDEFAGVEIFLAVILCAIQLYADFSGCMDMVCGVAQTMGVNLDQNFNHPFFSRSAAEFWRRWHITLGAWYKDYILMPIATNKKFMTTTSKIRKKFGVKPSQFFSTAVPAIVVWILTGMWHGTGLPYLFWGLYWGAIIILATTFAPELKKITTFLHINVESWGYKLFQMIRTFLFFCIGRMFTVVGPLAGCFLLWKQLFADPKLYVLFDGTLYEHGLDQKNFYVCLFGMILMLAVSILQEKGVKLREEIAASPIVFRWIIYYGAIVLILIFGMYGTAYDASNFVYGGF